MDILGYNKALYVLAFDHRASFVEKMFGWTGQITEEQAQKVSNFKWIIYQGLLQAIEKGAGKDAAAVLADEQFGSRVHEAAREAGIKRMLTVEKSGQEEFDFEYGQDFGQHLLKFQPDFAKALIRYNPEGDSELNHRQAQKLKLLGDFCHQNGIKFLIEPLVPATKDELDSVGGDQKLYDQQIRPHLVVEMIKQLQDAGVEVDVWKIEGLEQSEDYQHVVAQARVGGRDQVGVVVLGRGADEQTVEQWLKAAKGIDGVTGFAIGRTIFWQPLSDLRDGKITAEEAVSRIAESYLKFCRVFEG